jgi:peroxiredoxin
MKKFLVAIIALVMALPSLAQLPSVQLKDVDGNAVNTAELSNDGKPFVISFWATWCKPCQRELKAIHEVYPDWQDETGMKLIVVSIDEAQNAERVKTTIDGRGWEYEVVLDPNGEFKRQMGVQNPPHTFIVDGKGSIVWSHQGYTDSSEEEIIEKIREIIGE